MYLNITKPSKREERGGGGIFVWAQTIRGTAHHIKYNETQLCGYIPIKPARLTGILGSKRHRVKRHLKLASLAHAISSKRLMTLNDSLDSIGWAKSYHVKDYHMREVKHERNWTGLFSISRRILQGSIMGLNSLYKFSFILDLVINLPRYRKIPKISPSKYKPPKS